MMTQSAGVGYLGRPRPEAHFVHKAPRGYSEQASRMSSSIAGRTPRDGARRDTDNTSRTSTPAPHLGIDEVVEDVTEGRDKYELRRQVLILPEEVLELV